VLLVSSVDSKLGPFSGILVFGTLKKCLNGGGGVSLSMAGVPTLVFDFWPKITL
jgi:hypothetical protein